MLWSLIRWHEKHQQTLGDLPLSVVSQTAATAFVVLTVCALRMDNYKCLWWIAGLSDRFFEVLTGGAKQKRLRPMIQDLLIQMEPMVGNLYFLKCG